VNVPVIAVGLVLAWRMLPSDRPDPGAGRARLDVIGLALLAPALAGILLGLSNLSEDGGIDHAGVLVPLLAGIALLGAFTAWALSAGDRQPVVDIRLLRLRSLGTASTVLFTAGAAMYAGMFLLPLYYQQLHGETVLYAGLLLIPQGAGSLAARFAVGKLVARFGARLVTIASFLIAAAATVPFAFAGPHTSLWPLGAVLVIRGFGIGAVLVPPMSVAYQDVPLAGIPHATMNTRIAQQVGPETVAVSVGQNQVIFELGEVLLSSRLIDGQFPNYRQLLPEAVEHELRIASAELTDVVRRISLLAQKNAPLRLSFSEGELTISAQTPDVGEAREAIPLPFAGEPFEIGFNPEFLREGLESIESDELVLKLISPLRPGLIESPDSGDFVYLIMPIRLNV